MEKKAFTTKSWLILNPDMGKEKKKKKKKKRKEKEGKKAGMFENCHCTYQVDIFTDARNFLMFNHKCLCYVLPSFRKKRIFVG